MKKMKPARIGTLDYKGLVDYHNSMFEHHRDASNNASIVAELYHITWMKYHLAQLRNVADEMGKINYFSGEY